MSESQGSILLHGGPIYTMNERHETATALLAKGGRITAVGDADEIQSQAPPDAIQVDLGGRAAIPGLVDSHPHVAHFGSRGAGTVDISDAVDHDEIVARIRARAELTPAGEWIRVSPVGEPGYFVTRTFRDLDERTLPDRWVLDRATSQHPVIIEARAPRVPNVVSFNSLGLRVLGLTNALPDRVADVWVDRNHDGVITGVFRGSVHLDYNSDPFWAQVASKIRFEPADEESKLAGVRAEMSRQNSMGVTSIYEPHAMGVADVDLYRTLNRAGELSLRVVAGLEVEMFNPLVEPSTPDEFAERLQFLAAQLGDSDEWLKVESLSGSFGGGLSWAGEMMSTEPYLNPFGQRTKGVRFIPRENVRLFVEFCAREGIRANVLPAGGHEEVLDFLELPHVADRVREHKWVVVHSPIIVPSAIKRYARLGMLATTSVGFLWAQGDVWVERFGEHILRDGTPLRTWLDAGVTLAQSSDWGPRNPFKHLQLSERLELAVSGRVIENSPQHRLTRREAFETWTRNGAAVLGWSDVGQLRPGALADVAVLDTDPFACTTDELGDISVEITVVNGKIVYDASTSVSG